MRNRYILALDMPLIAIAAFGAFALRFDWMFLNYRPEFRTFLVAALVIKPVVFYIFGMYTRYWRYATANDLLAVTLAVSASSVVMAVYIGVGRAFDLVGDFSRPVLLIDWLLALTLVGGLRMSVRVIGEAHQKTKRGASGNGGKRVLVVGAGEAGTLVAREMQRNPQLHMLSVGFLDDDRKKLGKRIYGSLVLGAIADLERIVKIASIDEVVIAMPRASGAVVRAVVERCQTLGLRCRTIPGVFELLDGQISISRLRQIEITDLLRRSQIHLAEGADGYLAMRTVMVTGAGGSIGLELCRQVAAARPQALFLLGHGENSIFDAQAEIRRAFPGVRLVSVIADIRDRPRITRIMGQLRPDVVFHAAAHKHVPLMEENPQEAVSNNVIGTRVVVDAAIEAGVERLVMISTDKAVAPVSLMGASKRMAELIVRDAAERTRRSFVVVRFGNVLGSRGSVVTIFKRQIEDGGPITITDAAMRRFFMTIPEAVHLVIQAGGMGRGGELFALNMGEPVRIVDLADDLIRLSGLRPGDIPIVFTGPRPGEKLEEGLWERDAIVERTDHPDVLCIREPNGATGAVLEAAMVRLSAAVHDDDRIEIEATLATCLGTFTPRLNGLGVHTGLNS
jgi:FlaA1/EpsC-like NDP-sugar epimerase